MVNDVSRRGVYYNLKLSPYYYITANGLVLKFSSQKKLDMYNSRIDQFKLKFHKLMDKYRTVLGDEWYVQSIDIMERNIYNKIYDEIEG